MADLLVWHGLHDVPESRMIMVTIGPLALSISHHPGEWRLGWRRSGDLGPDSHASVTKPRPITDPDPTFTVQRALSSRPGDVIRLRPLLADRPVVARPELPLMVPADDEAIIFVSTPVWVRAELPEPERRLLEIPVTRPSDTWFGPDTRRGVVAYASQTAARLHIDSLMPPLAHRAITRVTVRNQMRTVLHLERVSVPAPSLPLFASRDGSLWTAPLVAVRDSEASRARVELGTEPPPEATDATMVAEPREPTDRNVLSRALHVLVG